MTQLSMKTPMDVNTSDTQRQHCADLRRLAQECALDEALKIYVFSRFCCDLESLGEFELAEVSDLFLPIIIDMKSQLSELRLQ